MFEFAAATVPPEKERATPTRIPRTRKPVLIEPRIMPVFNGSVTPVTKMPTKEQFTDRVRALGGTIKNVNGAYYVIECRNGHSTTTTIKTLLAGKRLCLACLNDVDDYLLTEFSIRQATEDSE